MTKKKDQNWMIQIALEYLDDDGDAQDADIHMQLSEMTENEAKVCASAIVPFIRGKMEAMRASDGKRPKQETMDAVLRSQVLQHIDTVHKKVLRAEDQAFVSAFQLIKSMMAEDLNKELRAAHSALTDSKTKTRSGLQNANFEGTQDEARTRYDKLLSRIAGYEERAYRIYEEAMGRRPDRARGK